MSSPGSGAPFTHFLRGHESGVDHVLVRREPLHDLAAHHPQSVANGETGVSHQCPSVEPRLVILIRMKAILTFNILIVPFHPGVGWHTKSTHVEYRAGAVSVDHHGQAVRPGDGVPLRPPPRHHVADVEGEHEGERDERAVLLAECAHLLKDPHLILAHAVPVHDADGVVEAQVNKVLRPHQLVHASAPSERKTFAVLTRNNDNINIINNM